MRGVQSREEVLPETKKDGNTVVEYDQTLQEGEEAISNILGGHEDVSLG